MRTSTISKNPNGKIFIKRGNESGIVLILSLIFLCIIAFLGSTAVVLTTTDMKIGSNYRDSIRARTAAQAGVQEALYRLGLFDDNTQPPPSGSYININGITDNDALIKPDATNPSWKAKILFNTSAPAGWVTGENTFYTNTIQPSASWPDLEYSASTNDGTALTIEFLTEASSGNIVYYDGSKTPRYYTGGTPGTDYPVLVITSTGKANGSISKIQVRAVRQPINVQGESSVMVDMGPDLSGSALISGFNHSIMTTYLDEKDGPKWHSTLDFMNTVDNHGGGEGPNIDIDTNLTGSEEADYEEEIAYGQKLEASGHKPGVWTTQPTDSIAPGNIDVFGGDDTVPWKVEGATSWKTLADLLGVSQETVDRILASANVKTTGGILTESPQGVIYIDNAASGDLFQITSSTPDNEDGWGLMYITGNAKFLKLHFKGLIYVEGDAEIESNFWLLGCIAIKGDTLGDFSAGNGTFLYSAEALQTFTNRGMKFTPLAWKDDAIGDPSSFLYF